ncbi:MAG: hypothetical protein IID46_14060, partial [Planctomycetes bacterium]|nr:hypothetical protein [Planctomycetota bacterium]
MYRQSPGEALIEVMTSTVLPDSWELNGGYGTIEEFNGLLVVRASQEVHREIKNLLEMMREAAQENHGRKKAVPTAAAPRGGSDAEGGF